jgi:hypothetical protein
MAYTVGMVHGAIPHSHFLESHDAEQSTEFLALDESDDAGLIRLLVHIFSESETTDIADYFVNETSNKEVSEQSVKITMATVLSSFVSLRVQEVDISYFSWPEIDGNIRLANDQTLSRRGPPVVS